MAGLTVPQYYQVLITFFLSIGAMLGASAYFFVKRFDISQRYRLVVTLCAVFCLIAAANYFFLYLTLRDAVVISDGVVRSFSGVYDDSYRYADWILTVPLQLVAFTLILDTPAEETKARALILALLGAEMIMLGYPGQVSGVGETRWQWFTYALVPFLVILGHLYSGMGSDIEAEPEGPRDLILAARLVLVLCWPVYAGVFVVQTLGHKGPLVFVGTQVAYAAADIGAKILFAVLITMAAEAKSALRAPPSTAP